MRIAIGSDHAGFELKEKIRDFLAQLGQTVHDVGCHSTESVHYPEIGREVAELVASGQCDRGILICGTGLGMSIVANRVFGIRAALCNEPYVARMSREHNDSNVLCMGGRIVGQALAEEMVRVWLDAPFAGGRHALRTGMIDLPPRG